MQLELLQLEKPIPKPKAPKESKLVALRDCPLPEHVQRNAAQADESLRRTEPHSPVRILKIEADGDIWRGLIKPKIRIMGKWLERAGFKPGNRVQVTCVAPGVIELRSPIP